MNKTIIITIILIILLVVFIVLTIYFYLLYIKLYNHLVNDYKDGKHYCNYCRKGYIHNKEERAKTICDYCHRQLTLHIENPDYVPEEEPQEKPFADF